MSSVSRSVFIIALIQFVNIVDFMMVMPLGPFFVDGLSIASDQIGWISGSYTFAAALSGILLSPHLDRLPRKKMIVYSAVGLGVITIITALIWDLATLMFMRLLAGIFGGLVTSLSLSMVIDITKPESRGKAIAMVMSAFSFASIIGVPIGLELALRFSWHAPFLATGIMALLVSFFAQRYLPNKVKKAGAKKIPLRLLMANKTVVVGYLMIATVMFSGFLIIPFITNYFVYNLGFPRGEIGMVYLMGGFASLLTMQLTGRWVDKWGVLPFAIVGTAIFILVTILGFAPSYPVLSVYVTTILFMVGMNMRGITNQVVLSKIPSPDIRAGFMSMQNAVQHISTTLAAICGSLILTDGDAGGLIGMATVVTLAVLVSLLQPMLIIWIKKSQLSFEVVK